MSDMISTCMFATGQLTQLRHKIGLVALALVCAVPIDAAARESEDWIVLANCRFMPNPANDADSFHISVGSSEYIFRLYLVDAPETDALTPGRLVEQSKYFEITVPQVIEVGEAAEEFTRKKLSEPFTVFTRMSDAMGRSKLERFYAFVQTNEGDLGEQLVRNGLARGYGAKAIPPGFSSARPELKRLQELEDEARKDKIGSWGINAGRLNVRAPDTLAFSVFVPGEKAHSRATPLPNASVPISATRTPRPWIVTRNPVDAKTSHLKEKIELAKIDINAATEKELKTIPSIGPVMAARIIAARPFRSADDL